VRRYSLTPPRLKSRLSRRDDPEKGKGRAEEEADEEWREWARRRCLSDEDTKDDERDAGRDGGGRGRESRIGDEGDEGTTSE
jgi:hypothetical protein